MSAIRRHRRVLLGAIPVLAGSIFVLAPRYLAAQSAADAATFREVVAGQQNRFAAAAVADLLLAAAYGVSALAYMPNAGWLRRALGAVALAAVADEVENILIFASALGDPSHAAIRVMRASGTVKNSLFIVALLAVVLAIANGRCRD